MSRPKRNCMQCPKSTGQRAYASTGRPFTLPETVAGPACSTYDTRNAEYSGRAFNPLEDAPMNCLAKAQNTKYSPDGSIDTASITDDTSYSCFTSALERPTRPHSSEKRLARLEKQQLLKQLARDEERMNLECEMARHRDIALQRLKGEQLVMASNALPAAQTAMTSRKTRQHVVGKDQSQQSGEQFLTVCEKQLARDAGHQMVGDRYYNFNVPALHCPGKAGRQMEIDRDLTYRRLNLPTPKNRRARSCPAPLNVDSPSFSGQQTVHPSPAQSERIRSTRSISPPEARYFEISESQTPKRSLRRRAESLAKPAYSSAQPPVYYHDTSSSLTPIPAARTIQHTSTSQAGNKIPFSLQQRSLDETSPRAQDTSFAPRHAQHNLGSSQDYATASSTGHEQTPAGTTPQMQYALKIPMRTANEMNQITNATLKSIETSVHPFPPLTYNTQRATPGQQESVMTTKSSNVNRTLTFSRDGNAAPALDSNNQNINERRRIYHLMDPNTDTFRQNISKIAPLSTQEKSYYYNDSVLDNPSLYGRRSSEVPGGNATQYIVEDMDISAQAFPSRPTYPTPTEKCPKEQSWKISQKDLTCIERSNASQQTTVPASTVQTSTQTLSAACQTMDHERDSTQYLELPSNLKAPFVAPQICKPCEQPKASLFHCIAKKLGSIYNIISSTVASYRTVEALKPQVMDQATGPMGEASTFGTPDLCSTTIYGDMLYDSRDMFNTPCIDVVDELPASVKECAHAKRCGHVQFDSSDKRKLQDADYRALRQAEIDCLVKDAYCPGLIQETVDGQENFNHYSFSMHDYTDGICTGDPMTLLEAFSMRIDQERSEIMKKLKENFTKDQIVETIKQHFDDQNPTDLKRAIKGFLISEQLLDRDEFEKAEDNSFEAEVQKWVTAWPGGDNMKLVSYTGRTRPTKEEAKSAQAKSN